MVVRTLSCRKGSAKAITAGAHIQVQLSRLVVGEDLAISSQHRLISSLFPSGSIRAQLAATNGKIVDLDSQSTSLSAEDSRLSLSSTSGVPLNLRYSSVKVCSDVLINGAEVYWVNYSK